MKKLNLFLCTLLSCFCNLSHAQCPSKAVCDKGIFPQTAPDKESVAPTMTDENETEDMDSDNSNATPSDSQKDNNSQTPSGQDKNKKTPPSTY